MLDDDNDFEDVLTTDAAWWAGFQYRLGEPASNAYAAATAAHERRTRAPSLRLTST